VIVVDTNIISYLYLQGDHTLQAENVLKQDADWVSSRLWRSEFRNVLAFYLRQRIISLDEALKMVVEAEALMQDKEYEVPSIQVLNLAARSGASAYDCEFVALAQSLKVPLVTSDKKILREFPSTAISLKSFGSL
jgi:predicted nucleic acid-binding protein